MKKLLLILAVAIFSVPSLSQEQKFSETEIEVNPQIKGTLYNPEKQTTKPCLVILIAGSGPTNRNGNQVGGANNALKFLAQGLVKEGNAVYSYDKRTVTQIKLGKVDPNTVFEDYIADAKDVIAYFRAKNDYSKIIVAGHSEGALVGLIASQEKRADAYISLAGAGRPIDGIIVDQIAAQMASMRTVTEGYFDKMRKGEAFEPNPMLQSLFNEGVRPYLLSWMKYDPRVEIKKLNIPVLIVNGTKDIQVEVSEAEALATAKPDAKLVIIENMNHVFKEIKTDHAENMASYSNPNLPVMPELISAVNQFIKSL